MTLKCTHTDCNGTAKVPVSLAAKAAVESGKTDEREVTATCGHTVTVYLKSQR